MKTKILCLLVALSLTGCLEQDIQKSVLYLEADESVTWRIHMTAIDDGEADPEQAAEKYRQLLLDLSNNEDFFSEAMLEIGAFEVKTQIIRQEPPLEFTIEGRFDDLDPILEAMLEGTGIEWEMIDMPEGLLVRFAAMENSKDEEEVDFPFELIMPAGKVLHGDSGLDPRRVTILKPADWDGLELLWFATSQ